MAFGWASAGAGAAQGLEEILAQQMVRAQLAQRQKEAEQQAEIERQRLAESIRSTDIDAGQRQQQIDMQAGDRRERSNVRGVRRMLGESITQRTGPITTDDRRGMAALQVEAGDDPTLLNEPKVERDPIADHEAKARIDARYRRPESTAQRKPEWVRQADGSVIDINGVAPPGTKPYDAVAERSSQPVNPAEAQDTAREAARLAGDLLKHPGLGGAFGVVSSQFPTVRQDTADAESLRDSLTSLLTLENTGKLKGVLSNTDMQILRQASTSLNSKMGDAAARAELKRIVEVMQRAAGEGPQAGLPKMDMATSRGSAPAAVDPVDAMIAKHSRKK